MTFSKTCPKCGSIQTYVRKKALLYASKRNSQCVDCGHKQTSKKLSVVNKGKKLSAETRAKMSEVRTGLPKSDKWKKVMSEKMKGNTFGRFNKGNLFTEERKRNMRGKPKSKEAKRNMRLAAIRRIKRNHGVVVPNYNPDACKAIDEFGKRNGFNFQHALNGGEYHIKPLGYWVDGYDEEQNVVIEFDEPYHLRYTEKDMQRQQEIQEHLGCAFIRIT